MFRTWFGLRKFGGWYDISSPKFYELLIKIELKGDTDLYHRNFYNHINICLNRVNGLWEDIITDYHSIKIYYDFEEYFVPDCNQPSYYWNSHTYNYLGHSPLVVLDNGTYVKSSMEPQVYKLVNIHAHEIPVWKILSRLIHSRSP